MTPAAETIRLSLISHTNVGKTTLARTLLGRDIGEVRDEAHVTETAERHTLIESPEGDRLELWDTPGFGDSLRLAKRLAQAGNPLGWFLSEVWDRYRDRAFWSSQRALRHVLDEAEIVLYLVNAAEAPEDAGYLDAELKVLALIGKPVLLLLNQLGPPRPAAEEAAEVGRWRERVAGWPGVRGVLGLDAFARCWVQEGELLSAVEALLPPERRPVLQRLRAAWERRGRATWQAAMGVLAERLLEAALDTQEVRTGGWAGRVKEIGSALGLRGEAHDTPRDQAMALLGERLQARIRSSTEALIRLHGLDGRATEVVLTRLGEHFSLREPVPEGKAAVLGGVVTGALAGLKADIVTGGLTMGGGLLAGSLLGALGALGLARSVNLVRGLERPTLAWSDTMMGELFRAALVGYLAVAHFGRGRGDWAESEHPAFWLEAAGAVTTERHAALQRLWARRAAARDDAAQRHALAGELRQLLGEAGGALLARLYPNAAAVVQGA